VRFFVCDEARIGQQRTLTRVWAPTGSRPSRVKQCEYDWLYLWAAVDPSSGDSIAMMTPTVNAELMQTFIAGLSGHIKPDEHAVLVLDNAGWHHANRLASRQDAALAGEHDADVPAGVQPGTEPGGERVAVSAKPSALEPGGRGLRVDASPR
jgi:hypothetical protein